MCAPTCATAAVACVEWGDDGKPVHLKGEQTTYLRAFLDIFDVEGVDTRSVNTFARSERPVTQLLRRADHPGRV